MTAMSADRLVNNRLVTKIQMPVKAAALCYSGALAFNDAGYVRGGVPTAITPVLGFFDNHYDNSGGGAGALNANISCDREAIQLAVGGGADALGNVNVGDKVYAIDDQTVGATSGGGTRPIAGILVRIDASGMAWVKPDLSQVPGTVLGLGAGVKIASGQHTMLSAQDTIVTGLALVVAIIAVLDSAPILTCDRASASKGDQNAAPIAGDVYLEVWMPTDATHTTPIAATGYAGMKVNWIAVGF